MGRPGRAKSNWKHNLKRWYGITEEQYNAMLKKQDYSCAICDFKPRPGDIRLSVDHSHKNQSIRGLLCRYCNIGLGGLKDSPTLLKRAAQYLLKSVKSNRIRARARYKVIRPVRLAPKKAA